MSAIAGMFLAALLSMLGKLASQTFFEAVLTKIMIYAGEKLAPMTTNALDDELVALIKERLSKPVA